MGLTLVAATASALLAGIVQAVSGFGFALLAAPVLAVLVGPRASVADLALIGVALNVVLVVPRARAGRLRAGHAPAVVAWAAPGVLVGALLLGVAPTAPLLLAVGIASIGGAIVLRRGLARPSAPARIAPAALAFGVLTTLTGTNGPPLVLHLARRGVEPDELRDTLLTCFLVVGPAGIAALVLTDAWAPGGEWPVLVVGALAGAAVGARLRGRLDVRLLERLTLVLLALAGVTALVASARAW